MPAPVESPGMGKPYGPGERPVAPIVPGECGGPDMTPGVSRYGGRGWGWMVAGRTFGVGKNQMDSAARDGQRDGVTRRPGLATRETLFRSRFALMAVAVAIAGGAVTAAEFVGEEPLAVREAIGGGIHAYHAGDFNRAYDDLTNAIEAGTDDPRSYYFRGLAALRLGRTSEAEADFSAGADRELSTGSIRRVSLSLERVQGQDRLTLERFRARARLGALQRGREAYERRYSTIDETTNDVRRRRRPEDIRPELVAPRAAPEEILPPAGAGVEEVPAPAAKAAPPAKPSRTFADEPADEPAEEPAEEPAAESDDPFGDEPTTRKNASEDEAYERTVQDEELDAEVEDTAAERDVQDEVEAASGQ